MTTKTWTVQVNIDEDGDDTYADAILTADNKTEIHGRGVSRRHPRDEAVPHIGDELASARALSDLAHQLLSMAAGEIEDHTHTPVRALHL
ncbi:DUF1876 domain-containing protein [Nocardioides antri]|uniref:DUF1876 domain-containing protein n=1 Tax=Nocardioides antri TaxID=2607659 RepID=A0A5B1M360_9ACTN|nr:DUF1876 domain-containing protein [Nocardioides antri]KAA1427353.1 DUF1876 domain-containing protein [Nocardioides antri]